jgi:hypothetical protein
VGIVTVIAMLAGFVWWVQSRKADALIAELDKDAEFANLDPANAVCFRYKEPDAGEYRRTRYELDFSKMELVVVHLVEIYETEETLQVARRSDGAWFHRSIGLVERAPGVPAKIEAPELTASEPAWRPMPRDFIPWTESSYQQCVRFFAEHPGFSPDLSMASYRDGSYDTTKVWVPRPMASDSQLRLGDADNSNA